MKKIFKNFIKSVQNIKLSEIEKSLLRSKISEFISFHPIRGKIEIPGQKNYLSIFEVRHFVKALSLVLILAVVVGGTGVSYAAQSALPGDKLYGIKTNVNESLEGTFALSTEAKIVVQTRQVERRLEEAQTLVKTDKLSPTNTKIVEDKLEKHIQDLSKSIQTLKNEGSVEAVLETTANLTPVLEAHKEILKDKNEKSISGTETLVAKVEDSILKVEAEENLIISEVGASQNTNIQEKESTLLNSETLEVVEISNAELALQKEARENLEKISDQINTIVRNRIRKAGDGIERVKKNLEAKEKIEALFIKNEESKALTESPTKETVSSVDVSEKNIVEVGGEIEKVTSTNSVNVTGLKTPVETAALETALMVEKTEPKESLIKEVVTETESEELRSKIKEAERTLRDAENAFESGKIKDALELAQKVNKIVSEIEIHIKLKELELAKNNNLNSDQKASSVQSVR